MSVSERKLADALQACLEAIEAGASPAEALSAQPLELRAALRSRLQAGSTLRAHRPCGAPAFDATLRSRLAEVDAERDARRALPAWLLPSAPLGRAAAILLALGLAFGSASFAAASLLPEDHWLQTVVQPIERVRQQIVATAADLLPGFASDPSAAPDALSRQDERTTDRRPSSDEPDPDSPTMGSASRSEDRDAGAREGAADRSPALSNDGPTGRSPLQRDPDRVVQIQPVESTPSTLATPIRRSGPTQVYAPQPEDPPTDPPVVSPPATTPSDPEPDPPTATDGPAPATATPIPGPTDPLPTEPAATSTQSNPSTPEPTQPQPTIVVAPTNTPPGPPPMPSATPTTVVTTGSISGRIFTKDEDPLTAISVTVRIYSACPRSWDDHLVAWDHTDPDNGRYRVEDIDPGRYWVAVLVWVGRWDLIWHESEHRCEDSSSVRLGSGEDLRDIDITLRDRRDEDGPGRGDRPDPREPGRGGGTRGVEPGEPGSALPPIDPAPTLGTPPVEPTRAATESRVESSTIP